MLSPVDESEYRELAIEEARPALEALLRAMPVQSLERIARAGKGSLAAGGTQCAVEIPAAAAKLECQMWIQRPGKEGTL